MFVSHSVSLFVVSVLMDISGLCKHLNNHMPPATTVKSIVDMSVQVRVNGGDRQSERGLEITVALSRQTL